MCKSILNTLRIKDKNLNFSDEVIEKKHKGRMSLFYYAELTYQPTHCENCSTKNENFSIVKNGKKTSTITLLKIMEIHQPRPRFWGDVVSGVCISPSWLCLVVTTVNKR